MIKHDIVSELNYFMRFMSHTDLKIFTDEIIFAYLHNSLIAYLYIWIFQFILHIWTPHLLIFEKFSTNPIIKTPLLGTEEYTSKAP